MTSHDYGPHRPDDAPQTIAVLGVEKYPPTLTVPLHRALVKQREHLNNLAHRESSR